MLFYQQARERLATYAGKISAKISWSLNHGPPHFEHREFGQLPIMLRVRMLIS